jgi:hypothetical protein
MPSETNEMGRRSIGAPSLGELWAFLAVALPVLASLLVPLPAVDLAYQLRAGADMLMFGQLPATDSYTFTVFGQPWLDQQWGAQLLLTAVFQATGWTGLAVLRAALVGATMLLLRRALRSAWSIASLRAGGSAIASSARTATLIVLLAFVVAAPALALRPQLFAIVLFAATLLILVERSAHPRRLWLIPVLAALWANLHGSFPLVIVLVGLAWLDEVALLREPVPAGQPQRRLRTRLLGSTGLAIIGAASTLATLATPFGIEGWRYIENLARNPAITSLVSEWRPPSLLEPSGAIFYLSVLVVLGVVAFRLRSDNGRPPARFLAPIASVVVFGILGAITGRGLAWWAIAAPVAMVSLQPGLRLADVRVRGLPEVRARTARAASLSEARRSPLNTVVMGVLILASVALLPLWRPVGPAGVPNGSLTHAPQGIATELKAIAAEAAARAADVPLGVWAPQTWGSWLELQRPEMKVAVDSRIELFPPAVWADNATVSTATGDWTAIADRRGASVLVVSAEQGALRSALGTDARWTKRYEDAEGSIWLRVGARP